MGWKIVRNAMKLRSTIARDGPSLILQSCYACAGDRVWVPSLAGRRRHMRIGVCACALVVSGS